MLGSNDSPRYLNFYFVLFCFGHVHSVFFLGFDVCPTFILTFIFYDSIFLHQSTSCLFLLLLLLLFNFFPAAIWKQGWSYGRGEECSIEVMQQDNRDCDFMGISASLLNFFIFHILNSTTHTRARARTHTHT